MDNVFLLIIGAPKAGTTSLARWLAQHPAFFLSRLKEPGFFRDKPPTLIMGHRSRRSTLDNIVSTEREYLELFREAAPGQVLVDASTDYLSDEGAPERIRAFASRFRVKLACILRDPIDRAFSEYRHTLRNGAETLGFREALLAEEKRASDGWQPLFLHARRSLYHAPLSRYAALFGRDLLVLDFDGLRDGPAFLDRVLTHVGVANGAPLTLDLSPENRSVVYRSRLMKRLAQSRRLRDAAASVLGRRAEDMFDVLDRLGQKTIDLDPSAAELLYQKNRDDIERCLEDDAFPTASWRSTRAVRERLLQRA